MDVAGSIRTYMVDKCRNIRPGGAVRGPGGHGDGRGDLIGDRREVDDRGRPDRWVHPCRDKNKINEHNISKGGDIMCSIRDNIADRPPNKRDYSGFKQHIDKITGSPRHGDPNLSDFDRTDPYEPNYRSNSGGEKNKARKWTRARTMTRTRTQILRT